MMEVKDYQQCLRCVMDTSDPNIRFDNHGYCNHCTGFLATLAERDANLRFSPEGLKNEVYRIKQAGKGGPYDCVLGVSGGIDSSYTAWYLKSLGLRTLLVHLDNGWNAEEAVQNIKNLAEVLGFDYESVVLNWKEFRDLQLSFLKASVIEAETPTDIAIPGALHRVAANYKVRFIISGGNMSSEGILPKHWHYNAKDTTYLNAVHKAFGKEKLRSFPYFGFKEETYYKLVRDIRMIYLLNYIPYDKEQAMDLLKKELNWKYYGGKHHESRYTKFVQSYLLPVKFNLDYRRATFSSQICAGQMTREEALERLQLPAFNAATIAQDLDYVAKKLGISRAELDEIIQQPPKTYRDYPNDEKRLTFFYNLYRRLCSLAFLSIGSKKLVASLEMLDVMVAA